MSALSNPAPAQQPAPQRPQRVLPVVQEPPRKPFPWKGWLAFAVILVGAIAAYQRWLKPSAQPQTTVVVARTGKVTAGPFQRTLRIGGVTAARQFSAVSAPRPRGPESRSSMELLMLVKDGSWVKKGATLAEIDPGYLVDHVDDIKSYIVQAQLDVDKRKSEQAVELQTLNQNVLVAKSQLDKANWENKAADVRTDIERELLKLDVEEAQAKYKQVQLDIPQKNVIHESELKILAVTSERHRRHLGRHESDITAFKVFAPMEGLVVVQSLFRGGEFTKIQQGDQLGSGQSLLKVVNPKSMQLEAPANQAEASEVRINQKATIGFDAFPGLTLHAKVYSIGALAVGGWRQNYYIRNVPLKLTIEGADERVIPDLSAYADIVVEEKPQATLVPVGAVHEDGARKYVFVKQGEQFAQRDVTLGSANNLHAVVVSGLQAGEEVRLD